MTAPSPPSPALPTIELGRHERWPALPALLFLFMMLVLGAVGILSLRLSRRSVDGLPHDPDVRAARDLTHDRLPLTTGGLRMETALLGEPLPARALTEGERGRIVAASERLTGALLRRPHDPRIFASLGHLDLALARFSSAEQSYRTAADFALHCGEAHLGLGVALALKADRELDLRFARSLRLESIAHFAAVRPADQCFESALYDRALMLARVGRRVEARRFAAEYLARDSAGVWADELRQEAR